MKNLLCFELRAFYDEFFSVGLRSSFLCLVLDSLFLNCSSITSTIINQSFSISAPEKKYHFYSSIWMSNQANHNKTSSKVK